MCRLILFVMLPFFVVTTFGRILCPALQRIATRETNTCESRQTPGLICESCELLSTCVKHSNGWTNIPVEMCDTQNGFYCNAQLGRCSNLTGPCHPLGFEGNFPCTTQGVFPDPYDCQKWRVCYFVGGTLISAVVDCNGDKAFNPATGTCTFTLQDDVCKSDQFVCNNAGDAGAWPGNPNIFYICKSTSNEDEKPILYPTLYRCADGEIFDGYYCIPDISDGDYTTTKIAQTTNVSTTDSPNPLPTTSTPPSNAKNCTRIGLSVDPSDCRKYYYCSAVNGVQRHLTCPDDTFYNHILSSCVHGTC